MSVLDRIEELRGEAETAIHAASSSTVLEELRVHYLGRKAELPNLLRGVAELPPAERGLVGKAANQARQALDALIAQKADALSGAELDAQLARDVVDVTLPGSPQFGVGRLHLITAIRREIEDVFLGLGFSVAEGPEIDLVYYNFDALNHDPAHPARSRSDTFYINDDVVLRTHTSPMQSRAMELQPPPIAIIVPGRTYRRDSDATHTPQFHQVEGLWVDEDITLADLKGTLLAFARAIFGDERDLRLRPHFFPFTEPSVEVDVSCFQCAGTGKLAGPRGAGGGDSAEGGPPGTIRCNLCKGTGWLEILGSGMVDPHVFDYVADHGYDPARVQGFAFGLGIERIAMLKHGIPDLRLYYENDVRFLEQFG
jgi:phenylalanyl-tRNA synthetase alpha chain